jgi:hypothetical protein
MRYLRFAVLLGICLFCASFASAQRVFVGVGVGPGYYGPPPVCAYGYYDYYPYACVPYGYYGPEWFVDGVFIGVGPWYRGYWNHGWYGRGFYGRGWRGDWDRDDWRGRGFRGRGWDHDGFQGRGFDHEGFGRSGGFHGGGEFHGGGGFHSGGHGGGHGGHR